MIEVITREEKAEKVRKKGFLPGILYGKKSAKIAVFSKEFKFYEGQSIDFVFEGQKYRGIIKEIQRHPLTDEVIHFDLFLSE